MSDFRKTWETYARSWRSPSEKEKRALYKESLAEDCVYTDPLTERRGWDDLVAYMVEFHQQIPGGHFRTTEFFAHHGRSVARWDMLGGDEQVLGHGISYGEYNQDGKLVAMTGFFDPQA